MEFVGRVCRHDMGQWLRTCNDVEGDGAYAGPYAFEAVTGLQQRCAANLEYYLNGVEYGVRIAEGEAGRSKHLPPVLRRRRPI